MSFILVLFLGLGSFSPMLLDANSEEEIPAEVPSKKKHPAIMKWAHLIFGTLAFEVCFLTADEYTQSKLIDQLTPQNLIKNFTLEYGTSFFITFMHELGHALAAHYLNDNPINIHLGASPSDMDDEDHIPLFESQHISLHGLNPNQALTSYSIILDITTYLKRKLAEYLLNNKTDFATITPEMSQTILEKIVHENKEEINELIAYTIPLNIKKQAAILLAGSVSGAASATLLNTIITMIKEQKISSETFLKGLKPTSLVFRNLTNMIIPRSPEGYDDASKLYHQCLGIPKKPLATIAEFAPLASLAAETWLAYDEAERKSIEKWGSIGLIALVNYFMRGYLRFTV